MIFLILRFQQKQKQKTITGNIFLAIFLLPFIFAISTAIITLSSEIISNISFRLSNKQTYETSINSTPGKTKTTNTNANETVKKTNK